MCIPNILRYVLIGFVVAFHKHNNADTKPNTIDNMKNIDVDIYIPELMNTGSTKKRTGGIKSITLLNYLTLDQFTRICIP